MVSAPGTDIERTEETAQPADASVEGERWRPSLKLWLGLPALVVMLGLAIAATILVNALEESRRSLETIVESDNAFVFAAADGQRRLQALNGRLHQILLMRAIDTIGDTEAQSRLDDVGTQLTAAVAMLRDGAKRLPNREAADQLL
jgi:hypothetical protein